MHLLRDPEELSRLMSANCPPELLCDFDPETWLADKSNFALVDGDDLGLAEAGGEWPGPLMVHLFFASRGKRALTTGRAMLAQCFAYGATAVRAEIQVPNRKAIMFARWLGLEPDLEIERPDLGKFIVLHLNNPQSLRNVA